MHPMDREGDLPVAETTRLEVEPAFGVALVVSSLSVAGSPEAVVVVGCFEDPGHIARVEVAVEEDAGLSGLAELEPVALGQDAAGVVRLLPVYFHFKTVVIKFMKEESPRKISPTAS